MWFEEEYYIDLLIAHNLIDVRALLARVGTRDEIRCNAISYSSEPKKK